MKVRIRGASENNLNNVDIDIGDGLTAVTGVSGSGKTSLVFDTMYHEARRRFMDIFNSSRSINRLAPANVASIEGIGPTIAVEQNLLNRNPNSTLATASGLHPFFRLLYTRFGTRHCSSCGEGLSVRTVDEIVEQIRKFAKVTTVTISAGLVRGAKGSHRTLLELMKQEFGRDLLIVDGKHWNGRRLNSDIEHDIDVIIGSFEGKSPVKEIREKVSIATSLGANFVTLHHDDDVVRLAMSQVCTQCGTWFSDIEPKHFRQSCIHCGGEGCEKCSDTGIHPEASAVTLAGFTFPKLMNQSVVETHTLFSEFTLPTTAKRLIHEITKRLKALLTVGLGYIQLNRPAPSLSRGESQRVRIAISLTSRLEDIVHVLDEPTIGQHPADVAKFLPAFRDLPGPVVFVEHDRLAVSKADNVVDIGPGAGSDGGEVVFQGTPDGLWKTETKTGRYFSLRERVHIPETRPPPSDFITIRSAHQHNLRDIDIPLPLQRLTVITGVSGSGKSTLVEHVLVPSLVKDSPVGCASIEGERLKPVMVDQRPIGKNPRSNPATYTKLSDIIRDLYASETGLSKSHFSFNRPEGTCPTCKGVGATEVKMRFLPSIWLTCNDCEGRRFNEEVRQTEVKFDGMNLSIADFYKLPIKVVHDLFGKEDRIPQSKLNSAVSILDALVTIGLGYLELGQPSPTLSGGEAQRVKLAKYLGKKALKDRLLILDEPSTGLHNKDLSGLLQVFDSLVRAGATVIVVEHNTDVIRAADWIVDLGPEGGPLGGKLMYAGPLEGFEKVKDSLTAKALADEEKIKPRRKQDIKPHHVSEFIEVRNATANNLRSVSVKIPKGKFTVVTGVSGSGKSSLVRDVLQAEAERRYLETLSLYERQGTTEGPEAPVESVAGLGVTQTITSRRRRGSGYWAVYAQRTTVGTVTEITHLLEALFSVIGKVYCLDCGNEMKRGQQLVCSACNNSIPLLRPRDFSPRTYSSACSGCSGVGHHNKPVIEKLIINPDKPLCQGAMHSPGYFPGKYFCEEKSNAAGRLKALGKKFNFDPAETPWNQMAPEAQEAFLYGDDEELEFSYYGTRRGKRVLVTGKGSWWGFFRILGDWDIGGTYTERVPCEVCNGTGFKPQFMSVKLAGYTIHELKMMQLSEFKDVMMGLSMPEKDDFFISFKHQKMLSRLKFLETVGLHYLHLNRVAGTLSAGEAQRIVLASLLGSGLTSLTILLDEPSRGMHPSEVESLVKSIEEPAEGNSVIVVEHDPVIIKAADELIDMGPLSGSRGGKIVAQGKPAEVAKADTLTGKWLSGKKHSDVNRVRRSSIASMTIKGARGFNLKDITVDIPLGVLVGMCGVSGLGKSTLMIDTVSRVLSPIKHTTSVAYEEIEPCEHDAIENKPERTIVLDQGRRGIYSPGNALGIFNPLIKIYAESEEAKALDIDEKKLKESCSVCEGRGRIRTEMGFLPDVYSPCETCKGTGRSPEAWDVKVKGHAYPELNNLTLGEVYTLFSDEELISKRLKPAIDVGLDYLVLRQPSVTLSGGEIQRLKIAQELGKKNKKGTLYILDEPTVGQHLEDVERLIDVLHKLVDDGNSVVVIEHHSNLLAACDWLIEMGPKGGPDGGYVIAAGTPEEVSERDTPSAPYLREVLEGAP